MSGFELEEIVEKTRLTMYRVRSLLEKGKRLLAARKRFYRRGSILHPAWTGGWILIVGIALLCTAWLWVFAHKHVADLGQNWWEFALNSHAPRSLRALVGVTALLSGFALLHLFAGRAKVPLLPAEREVIDEAAAMNERRYADVISHEQALAIERLEQNSPLRSMRVGDHGAVRAFERRVSRKGPNCKGQETD